MNGNDIFCDGKGVNSNSKITLPHTIFKNQGNIIFPRILHYCGKTIARLRSTSTGLVSDKGIFLVKNNGVLDEITLGNHTLRCDLDSRFKKLNKGTVEYNYTIDLDNGQVVITTRRSNCYQK